MRYLVDGYNLLHATGHLGGKVGPHGLERARRALLGRLVILAKAGDDVTVVFDARRAPAAVEPEQVHQGVHVRYALDREADDLIEELIRRDSAPRSLTVVSDDRRLKDAARRRRCATQGCLDFYDKADKAPRPSLSEQAPERPQALSEHDVRAWLEAFGASNDG
jgi:hypothetical protein